MEESTTAIAAGIAWATSILDAHDAVGQKIPPERYYVARAKIMVIEKKIYQLPYVQIKPIEDYWVQFKARLETHRPME